MTLVIFGPVLHCSRLAAATRTRSRSPSTTESRCSRSAGMTRLPERWAAPSFSGPIEEQSSPSSASTAATRSSRFSGRRGRRGCCRLAGSAFNLMVRPVWLASELVSSPSTRVSTHRTRWPTRSSDGLPPDRAEARRHERPSVERALIRSAPSHAEGVRDRAPYSSVLGFRGVPDEVGEQELMAFLSERVKRWLRPIRMNYQHLRLWWKTAAPAPVGSPSLDPLDQSPRMLLEALGARSPIRGPRDIEIGSARTMAH